MSVRQELPILARLATPVVLGNLALMLMGVVDMFVVARLGTGVLAAASLGNIWMFGTLLPSAGVLMGADPLLTQAHGAGDGAAVGRTLQRSLVLALPLSVLVIGLWSLTRSVLVAVGQSPALASQAQDFVTVQAWSVLPFLGWWALRGYLAARGIVAPAMWIAAVANVVNLAGNWVFVFGHLGVEARGLEGSGMATALSRLFMFAALAGWVAVRRLHVSSWTPWSRESFVGLWGILRHGLPAGGQFGLEVWGFSITGLFAGWLGPEPLAAHQVVLTLASLSFMTPMGVSIAAATRVGNLTGAGDEREARVASRVALGLGAGVMIVSALVFLLGRHALPGLFDVAPAVAALAAGILPIAAAFQIFDGTQVVGCGILRGRGDTQFGFWCNLAGYYVLGLPCAWLLAFHAGLGLAGLWLGLLLGLATVAVLLTLRILRRH